MKAAPPKPAKAKPAAKKTVTAKPAPAKAPPPKAAPKKPEAKAKAKPAPKSSPTKTPVSKVATTPVTSSKAPAKTTPKPAPKAAPAAAPKAAAKPQPVETPQVVAAPEPEPAPAPAPSRPAFVVAPPPNTPVRPASGGNPMSPRPPMGRPSMPPSFAVRGPGRPGFNEAQTAAPRAPAGKVELKAGDHVVYPTHGVGTVQGIEIIEAAGMELQMIVVTFEENRMTLRVPVNKVPTAGLRKLFTSKEFEAAIDTLKGRARIKRTMWSRRAQEYEAKINSGDPIQIAEVVRDLQRNAGQPDQSFSERQIYEQALERLAAEYAAIQKIDKFTASEQLVNFAKSS
ncbi:CarD family transcriptional regulator [Roseococcus sp. YIM B11640]|uniref:CarD family transcriptional regulator n=1 Tax=Roseococcus sp. YIM B11640 TaxID=3133973 RepID=UPI003C7B15B2